MTEYTVKSKTRHLDTDDYPYIRQYEKTENPKKYVVQLSKYGTVAYRADVVVEADSEEEAEALALRNAEEQELEDQFGDDENVVEGWNYQTENAEELVKVKD
jgi:hypothetical protein